MYCSERRCCKPRRGLSNHGDWFRDSELNHEPVPCGSVHIVLIIRFALQKYELFRIPQRFIPINVRIRKGIMRITGSLSLHSDREYQWRICSIPANSLPVLSEGGKGRQERETITGSTVLRVYEPPKSFLFSCKVQIECQRRCSLFRVQDQTTIGQFLH